jgi:NTP pyrophosphatase (non-canonical NTP hydrolase)
MTFSGYQTSSRKYAKYPGMSENQFTYPALGLCGETGEVAEKIKKVLRDKGGQVSPEDREEIQKELGDVLWYTAQLCTELGLDMSAVAEGNLAKLEDRFQRGKISGQGDNR